MNEPWRTLRIGERVRIVRLPTNPAFRPGIEDEFIDLYQRLISEGRVLVVEEIDHYGQPFAGWEEEKPGAGDWSHNSLNLNDNSWERVEANEAVETGA